MKQLLHLGVIIILKDRTEYPLELVCNGLGKGHDIYTVKVLFKPDLNLVALSVMSNQDRICTCTVKQFSGLVYYTVTLFTFGSLPVDDFQFCLSILVTLKVETCIDNGIELLNSLLCLLLSDCCTGNHEAAECCSQFLILERIGQDALELNLTACQ